MGLRLWILGVLLAGGCPACSCAWTGSLLAVAPRADSIVRGKVVAYHGRSRGIDLAMDVEVYEVLKGFVAAKRIRIWGDNGAQCRPYVNSFPAGTEWLFAIRKTSGGEYDISVCGEYWARVENAHVSGRLTSLKPPGTADKPETMSLAEFRNRLRGAGK